MEVLHIASGLGRGGAERMLAALIAGTPHIDHRVVSLTELGPVGTELVLDGVPVTALEMGTHGGPAADVARLAGLIREASPDVVQTWMYHGNLIGGLAARMASRAPVVWGLHHSAVGRDGLKASTWMLARAAAAASSWLPTRIVYCAHAARKAHEGVGYDPKHGEVIPNGFDTDRFKPDRLARLALRADLGLEPDTPLVGLVARLDPLKDHPTFLAAAGRIAAANPDVHFVLCGSGVTPESRVLLHHVDRHRIYPRTHLLGTRADMPRIQAALDVAVSSSIAEALPLAVGEAMACGVPCVVTDVGDSALMVGQPERVVAPRDADGLAEAVLRVLALEPDERRAMGMVARHRIAGRYGLTWVAGRYESLYSRLIPTNR